ncbi:MAG TPA: hypothetical protein VL359_04890, partial [bacterium]|nr:hypothetical protein [bacterium]
FEGDVLSLRRFFDEASRILAEMQGFPTRERSLELINVYFDQKKQELEAQTRVHLLLVKSHALGIREALLQPLERLSPREWGRLQPHLEELTELHKHIMLGNRQGWEQDRLVSKFIRLLRQYISEPTVLSLTRDESALFSWFFCSFPNRYLLARLPWQLANQMAKFAQFRTAQVLVDVVSSALGAPDSLLIYTRALPLSHSRVAYALSRKQINIAQGKINRVVYDNGEWGYCYYFQFSLLAPEGRPAAREMELLIAAEVPPALSQPAPASPYERTGVRLEFLGDDGKGYEIHQQGDEFARASVPYGRVRVVMRDQPYLFYKVSQVFDSFGAEFHQALITTTGNQVLDHFYLPLPELERLRGTAFEEFLINRVHTDLLRSIV